MRIVESGNDKESILQGGITAARPILPSTGVLSHLGGGGGKSIASTAGLAGLQYQPSQNGDCFPQEKRYYS